MSGTIIYFHVNIILVFPKTYQMLHCFVNQKALVYIKQKTW